MVVSKCLLMALALVVAFVTVGCNPSAPEITGTTPAVNDMAVPPSPATVRITFNQPMGTPTVVGAISITPALEQAPIFAWSSGDRILSITFPRGFAPETTYTLTIGIQAEATNDVHLAAPYVLKFTTGPALPTGSGPTRPADLTIQTIALAIPNKSAEEPALSFAKDIRPITQHLCKECHGDVMSDYANITARGYVVPRKPDESRYYTKPTARASHGGESAWKDKAETIRRWIEGGARE